MPDLQREVQIGTELLNIDEMAGDLLRDATNGLLGVLEGFLPPAYHPRGDRVLVYPLVDTRPRQAQNGLFTLDHMKEPPDRAQVVKVGVQARAFGEDIEEGQVVVFNRTAGQPVQIAGHWFRLVKPGDILATVEV